MMPSKPNRAFVLHGPNQAKLEPYKLPNAPGDDEVLCRTIAVGICGSDLHYWIDGKLGPFVIGDVPMVLGHETVAEIVKCGKNVTNLKPGDRVTIEPAIPCENCEYCQNDQYNLCPYMTCQATPPVDGTLQHYFTHPAKYSFKVPDNLTNDEVAMIEPLAVAVHACRRVQITKKSNILITGAGAIGLLVLQVTKAFGANRIVITDINADRLNFAKELGADETILIDKSNSEDKNAEIIREKFDHQGSDIAFECSGVAPNFRLIILTSKPGGSCMFVGMGPDELQLPFGSAQFREVKLFGSLRYKDCFPLAIDLATNKQVNLAKLVTHHYDFDDTLEAFKMAKSGKGIKIMIDVDRE